VALLVKFGYNGTCFTGFQKGNGNQSIEDSILSILRTYNIADDLRSAARTDRNVSASGNVLMISTKMQPEKTLRILNARGRDLYFFGYSTVDDDFNPRHCRSKRYVYVLSNPLPTFVETIKKFEGQHDFSAYCRKDARSTIRSISRIECKPEDKFLKIIIEGKSFVWEQIRSIIGFCNTPAMKDHFSDPFGNPPERRVVAPPEPLILADIEYDKVNFTRFNFPPKQRKLIDQINRNIISSKIDNELLQAFPPMIRDL
jgi:tRNA pseudouridine38-40 synthase